MIDDQDGEVLETIDEGLHDISKQILVSLGEMISQNTKKKIELQIAQDELVETIEDAQSYKIFNLGLSLDNKQLSMYILVKGK